MNPFDSNYFDNEEDRNDFFIALPVMALAGLFVLFFVAPSDIRPVSDSMQMASIETAPKKKSWSSETGEIEEVIVERPKVEARKIQRPTIQPLPVKRKKPALTPPPAARSTMVKPSPEPKQNTPVIEESTEAESSANPNEKQPETIVKTPRPDKTPEPERASELQPTSELNCSIAVGLYVEQKNINKMVRRLRNAGYNPVTVPLRRTTKVAIKIPCQSSQSQRILRDIRANFAHDAFIE